MGRVRRGGAGVTLAPWAVVWVDFDPHVGHEQAGQRPAIVVSSRNGLHIGRGAGVVMVVPTTTKDRDLPWHVPVALKRPSFAMCEQLRAVSTDRIGGRFGDSVSVDDRKAIRWVLRSLLDISPPPSPIR